MSLFFYKLIHLTGIFMILMSLAGMIMHASTGGVKKSPHRKRALIGHGIGLLLALVGGFGMLARLGIHWPWPGYIIIKIIIWAVLGGLVALIYRAPSKASFFWYLSLFLAILAGYFALYKPF